MARPCRRKLSKEVFNMQSKNIENYIEFLLSAAFRKCVNIHDAEDLTQETLFALYRICRKAKSFKI